MRIFTVLGLALVLLASYSILSAVDPLEVDCSDCNVVIIVIDTLRADHIGAYGYPRNITPHLDMLAGEGILYVNAYAQSSWTRPSTASILTGLYPKNHGAINRTDILSEKVMMLPEILKENGYRTVAVTSNGNAGSEVGFNQGFDIFQMIYGVTETTSSDIVTDKVLSSFEKNEFSEKFFLFIHYIDPHMPYKPVTKRYSKVNKINFTSEFFINADLKSLSSEERADVLSQMIDAYDDEILINDIQLGRLMNRLKTEGVYDNSIIIVLSDHGEEFFEHGKLLHGQTLYDESIHVPLLMRIPGVKPSVFHGLVEQVDILPTVLEILKIDQVATDGRSMTDKLEKDAVYSELNIDGISRSSIRTLDSKLIINKGNSSDGKPVTYEFFNLSMDKGELKNTYAQQNEIVKPFRQRLELYLSDVFQRWHGGSVNYTNDMEKNLQALGYVD